MMFTDYYGEQVHVVREPGSAGRNGHELKGGTGTWRVSAVGLGPRIPGPKSRATVVGGARRSAHKS